MAYQQGFVDRLVEAGFDVVRFDNRDVGRSWRSVDEYDASDMAADAIAVLDSVGWDPAWVRAKGAEMFDHGVDPAGTQRQHAAVLRSPVRDDMLQVLQVPALVLHDAADTVIDPSAGRHTADCLANVRYVEIDGLGHDLPPGMWARLVDEVAAFVTTPSP